MKCFKTAGVTWRLRRQALVDPAANEPETIQEMTVVEVMVVVVKLYLVDVAKNRPPPNNKAGKRKPPSRDSGWLKPLPMEDPTLASAI